MISFGSHQAEIFSFACFFFLFLVHFPPHNLTGHLTHTPLLIPACISRCLATLTMHLVDLDSMGSVEKQGGESAQATTSGSSTATKAPTLPPYLK